MRKRGRPCQFDLVALRVDGSPPPLDPPECLSDEQRSLFLELIGSINTAHFVPTDLPLLVSYVQATVLARGAIKNAATDAAALATWEKAVRVQATLATRLRLAP